MARRARHVTRPPASFAVPITPRHAIADRRRSAWYLPYIACWNFRRAARWLWQR